MTMMMIIGGLIDRTVSVDLLSCYLEFKYALSMLLTSTVLCLHTPAPPTPQLFQ